MRKVLEFRQNADECRTLAARMKTEIARKELLEIASHWEKLAEARIELVRAYPDRGNPPPWIAATSGRPSLRRDEPDMETSIHLTSSWESSVSLSAWLRSAWLHTIAGPDRWATVMARADVYESAHRQNAVPVVEDECIKLSDPHEYDLMQEVLTELRRRAHREEGRRRLPAAPPRPPA